MTNSMEEIVRAEIEEMAQKEKANFEVRRDELEQYGRVKGNYVRVKMTTRWVEISDDYFRLEATSMWNNFVCFLPDSRGFVGFGSPCNPGYKSGKMGLSNEEWQRDVITAIRESDIDEKELRKALDPPLHPHADVRPFMNYDTVERLILPIYIKLREMGYTAHELAS